MDMNNDKKSNIGILTICFIILFLIRITGAAYIEWKWVFAPFWIPICIVLLIAFIKVIFE
jgi:uncharacterized protein (DUF983 family)